MAKVRSSVVAYRSRPTRGSPLKPADPPVRAKLFANGRSQAVRLPKEFRMPGREVRISKEGDRVILEPVTDVPRTAKGWPIGFWERIDAIGQGDDFPDVEPMPVRFLDVADQP